MLHPSAHLAAVATVCVLAATSVHSLASSGGFGAKKSITKSYTPDQSPTIQTLTSFLKSQGAKGVGNDASEIGIDENGVRGLYATKNFKKNQIICRVPSDCALALADPDAIVEPNAPEPTVVDGGVNFLKFYAQNAQARQVWAPYLDTLPTAGENFDPTPDFYEEGDIDALEFPRAVDGAKSRLDQIKKMSEVEDSMSMEELQFATWIVSSRSFNIKLSVPMPGEDEEDDDKEEAPTGAIKGNNPNDKSIRVLVPYLDMINHRSDANAFMDLIDPEKDEAWFAIRASRPIKEGKEISISYGSKGFSSVDMLLNYGFIPDKEMGRTGREGEGVDRRMLAKGGEGILGKDNWSTSLEDDLKALENATGNARQVLLFKTKLKSSYVD
mmetsp:Transcript_18528/g.27101  ORF Transcript_18528/g.27101 Transcript_18528/m.27101 type:complete len:384 (-) Transcript_18528:193-1344(-)|eukprot:CAMPEP_0195519546 /NCGR_PEP_ID=MMETSP0794_2-20130614/15032_1 /TAXON_ID=515487 /ORGANISM="Stephanopyxis turris, Strain CCMP 815" /LENGTH=383 /DNA_ID=CAMNT_0040648723 /DNA_START=148 /DNA_END=1299 /DNA_ORIENTATION=+